MSVFSPNPIAAPECAYQKLVAIKGNQLLPFDSEDGSFVLCPDMGGRVFAELGGRTIHRIDLECVACPDRAFNNFGGSSFWPAPEGGKFGFNYDGDTWFVQECINNQPFDVLHADGTSATIQKNVSMTNRAGTPIDALMRREVSVVRTLPASLAGYILECQLAYRTLDSFSLLSEVSCENALIAAWTLEQFDASQDTIAFCVVENSANAINFDYYEHPGKRITYFKNGFTYRTDGLGMGQIGVSKDAGAAYIGFYDLPRNLLCIRENAYTQGGLSFNIADNNQSHGPYSAKDNYSIYNSNPEMRAFELETIGSAEVENGILKGSMLESRTTFVVFRHQDDLKAFIGQILDQRVTH